ncbi:hypothetical protein GCM10009554_38870 [Kribbella koreensis]|uniref:Uncharacterized protein n=1 Tax=Kribbella koreensis TaxID=57909 RepID=A0ABN1QLW8_9ACTN
MTTDPRFKYELPGDSDYIENWVEIFVDCLNLGARREDTDYLFGVLESRTVREKLNSGQISARAASTPLGILTLVRLYLDFIGLDTVPPAGGWKLSVAPTTSADHLSSSIVNEIEWGRREVFLRRFYVELRDKEQAALECCRGSDIQSWDDLWSAWLYFNARRSATNRFAPAVWLGECRPAWLERMFPEEERRGFMQADVEREEAGADIHAAMALYASDGAQETLRKFVEGYARRHGSFSARLKLRELRQTYSVTPWNYAAWESRLKDE